MINKLPYSLGKSSKILHQYYLRYKRNKKQLSSDQRSKIEIHLKELETAILDKDRKKAKKLAIALKKFAEKDLKKSFFQRFHDFIYAFTFAIIIAILVRQMWFENYTIPSGSMRPTLKEKDFLIVSKADFGINTPIRTSHLYFNPKLVKRGSIVVFTTSHMEVKDSDTTYFYIIPGKKQFVKRLVAKEGDTIYFYGGQIFGIDPEENEILEFRNDMWFQDIEHIPFIRFEGNVETYQNPLGISSSILYQMNEPVAKLTYGKATGVMLRNTNFKDYQDLWGFKNYAMARLLDEKDLKELNISPPDKRGDLYLQLVYGPSLDPIRLAYDEIGRLRPMLTLQSTLLPLDKEHIQSILDHMTTARFKVSNGLATRNNFSKKSFLPQIDIEDGCYEFENGTVYKVFWTGNTKKVPKNHKLYSYDLQQIKLLYNLGIEFNTYFSPSAQPLLPSRYAYFRNGDLYLLGYPIFLKDDPNLKYSTFKDLGSPLKKDGSLDKEIIKKYGLKIPDKMYLVLGDNHAMSADSREFGFVPEKNIRGKASFIFWPPGTRWGRLPQPYFWFSPPKLIINSTALIISIFSFIYIRKKRRRPLKF